ncbi:hypothetical protein WJX72_009852 [[Myrmecia] bisecta]|uniref:SF3 helicase domain-containing protein n=1 Tax=[Myrmecia] bisecta TaxID=41462 RepID=A0AAW1R8J9_9CHLO
MVTKFSFVSAMVQKPKRIVCSKSPDDIPSEGTWNEWFSGADTLTKPYFDTEAYYDANPGDAEHARVLGLFKDNVSTMCSPAQGFDPDRVLYGQRHGVDPKKNKYKVSFRAWVPGVSVKYTRLAAAIKDAKLAGDTDGKLDGGVYKVREQLLGCVGCHKGTVASPGKLTAYDKRVLRPLGVAGAATDYIVQHLNGDEVELALAGSSTSARKAKPVAVAPPTSTSALQVSPASQVPTELEDEVHALLSMFSAARWADYRDWVNVIIAVKHVGGDYFRGMVDKFSQTSPKYDGAVFAQKWAIQPLMEGGLSKGSLHHWAKEDDPKAYEARFCDAGVFGKWQRGDLGLIEMAHRLCGDVVKRDTTQGVWYFCDIALGKWREVRDATIKQYIGNQLDQKLSNIRVKLSQKASTATEDERPRIEISLAKLTEVIRNVRSNRGLSGILSLGSDMFGEENFSVKLDSVRHLLGVKNGVVDLRTGELRAAQPSDMVSREIDVDFDPDIGTDFIRGIVKEIMGGDEEMAAYLQKLLGYGITGETCEEVFVFFTAAGRNGKGFLMQSIKNLLTGTGFYVQAHLGLLCDRRTSNIDAERAKLQGGRIIVFNELKPEDRVIMDDFKILSGGDGLPAARKYGQPFTLVPQYLPICCTNVLPDLPVVDTATVERQIVVHFPVTFVNLAAGEAATPLRRQRDNGLKQKMHEHKPELLAWLVLGAKEWYEKGGLKKDAPAKVKEATNEYLRDQDTISRVLHECCNESEGSKESSSELLKAYNGWSDTRVTAKEMTCLLRSKGFTKVKVKLDGMSVQGYHNLQLKQD